MQLQHTTLRTSQGPGIGESWYSAEGFCHATGQVKDMTDAAKLILRFVSVRLSSDFSKLPR